MRVKDILAANNITFSFEFFPPKTEAAWDKLFKNISELMPLKPAWVSVTYGAGGSERGRTHDLVVRLKKETELNVIAHLTCVASTRDEIKDILEKYHKNGVENILALRGDPQPGQPLVKPEQGFAHAADLVSFIKKHYPHFSVGIAGFPEGHPDCSNRIKEIDYLKAKADAGADYIITQLFFDNRDYYDFCERCELNGINIPIIAGIMPIVSRNGMMRIAEIAGGARLPARLMKAVFRAENDEYVENVGVHWATEQVRDLIDHNTRGIHFYTLNNSKATLNIYKSLGVKDSIKLAGK